METKIPLLTATIIPPDEGCPDYSGWVNEEPGLVAQGETIEDVKKSLLDLYWIKKEFQFKQKIKNDKKTKS